MTTQFGWKKKSRGSSQPALPAFGVVDDDGEEDSQFSSAAAVDDDVDWLTASKRKHGIYLEDSAMKSKRLKEEGNTLAEDGRFWEAIKYWNDALVLRPNDSALHELKSQAYSELGELFPAVQCAEDAVRANPTWYIARQRLGRAQMGLGEVEMALKSFQKAVHLCPADVDLWKEDLLWAYDVVQHKRANAEGAPPHYPTKAATQDASTSLEDDSEEDDAYQ